MNEQVEETSKTPQYQTIGYGRKISDGNFGNRHYYADMQANGASLQKVVEIIEKDIQQQEALHEQVKTLNEQVAAAKIELECLKSKIQTARISFGELERLWLGVEESSPDFNDGSVGSVKLQYFKARFDSIKSSFDALEKQLGITRQSGYDEDIFQTDDDEDDIPL